MKSTNTPWRRVKIGPFWLHRREQWDLDCTPWLAVHQVYDHGNGSRRVFCIWSSGLILGLFWLRWGRRA